MPLTSTLEKTPPPLPGKTVDTTLPTVGGGLAVVTDSETSSGFSLSWTKGSDDQTAVANLKYLVYISASNNITGVSNAENNGTLLNPNEVDQLDINSFVVTGQNAETQYWATVILKDQDGNKSAYGVVTATTAVAGTDGLDSRAGDEAALESLNGTLTGLGTGWSSNMSLSDSIDGVTVATIGGELRVTEIDLRDRGLSGDVNITEWKNLKQCTLVNLTFNNLNSQIPQELIDLGLSSLRHLYLCVSDNVETSLRTTEHPHEAAQTGSGTIHPGKNKGSESNVWTGAIPTPTNPTSSNLEWFILNWSDSSTSAADGITSIPMQLWDIPTLVGFQIYENWNIAGSSNSFSFPSSIAHITNLENVMLGGGSGSSWDEATQGFMTGGYPSDFNQLTNIKHFWTHRNASLSGIPNLSNCANLNSLLIGFTDFGGQAFPQWLLDGSCPNIDLIDLNFPEGQPLTGQLPDPVDAPEFDLFGVMNNDMDGPIPSSFWTTRGGGPAKTNFSNNGFTSIGLTDMTGITNTSVFRWRNCEIRNEQWPNLDWSNNSCTHAWFENNYYVFRDMLIVPANAPAGETLFELWQAAATTSFSYSPQKNFGFASSINATVGSNVTINDFDAHVSHADNEYQWYKNGSAISGATSRSLTITNAQTSDSGVYELEVTNPGVPALTLTSEPIELTVE